MRKIVVVLIALMLTACSSLITHRPAQSEYFTTLGGGFMMTLGNQPSKTYGVNLQVKKPLPAHSYAVIEFENPANKTLPYITEGSIEDIQNTFAARFKNVFVLTSPHVHGVRPHTNYVITVSIYADESKQVLLTRHQQGVSSSYVSD